MPGKPKEFHIDNETRTALQANTGVRFLLRAKLTPAVSSRHSSDIITWAQNLSEKITKAVAEAAGHPLTTHFAMQLNVIRLGWGYGWWSRLTRTGRSDVNDTTTRRKTKC
jgi:hypothetical protein